MKKICTDCSEERWLPTSISKLEAYLSKFFITGHGVHNVPEIKKNIAYNLQYLQFQSQILREFKLTSVIQTQTWKVCIIVGTGIIEAILHYLLTAKGLNKKSEWEEETIAETGINLEGCKYKIENRIFKKLSSPKAVEMSLDIMIKKVESKKLLGANHEIYKKLQYLRKLRNRVHLHVIEQPYDTDWWKFSNNEMATMKKVLYSFMISSFFSPTEEEKALFEFLK